MMGWYIDFFYVLWFYFKIYICILIFLTNYLAIELD